MTIWTFSDLHQEHGSNRWEPRIPDGTELIIAPGDIHQPLTAALRWLHERFAGLRTIYVPGNHDFWCDPAVGDRYTLEDQLSRGRDDAARLGIDLLSDDIAFAGRLRIVGATLWTDYRLGSLSLIDGLRTSGKGMNDYRRIRRRLTGHHKYIRPSDILQLHRASRAFIAESLALPHDGPTVVATHHAPHAGSLARPNEDLRWAYASDLGDIIEAGAPDLWIHGHLHNRSDYRVGRTHIIANPRGHRGEDSGFDQALTVYL